MPRKKRVKETGSIFEGCDSFYQLIQVWHWQCHGSPAGSKGCEVFESVGENYQKLPTKAAANWHRLLEIIFTSMSWYGLHYALKYVHIMHILMQLIAVICCCKCWWNSWRFMTNRGTIKSFSCARSLQLLKRFFQRSRSSIKRGPKLEHQAFLVNPLTGQNQKGLVKTLKPVQHCLFMFVPDWVLHGFTDFNLNFSSNNRNHPAVQGTERSNWLSDHGIPYSWRLGLGLQDAWQKQSAEWIRRADIPKTPKCLTRIDDVKTY